MNKSLMCLKTDSLTETIVKKVQECEPGSIVRYRESGLGVGRLLFYHRDRKVTLGFVLHAFYCKKPLTPRDLRKAIKVV